jgi:dihydrofolate reductase
MRKIFVFLMATLDGYHETTAGDLSRHVVDAEFLDFAAAQLDEADTLLFGRKTYEHMAAFWPTDAAISGDPAVASRMNSFDKIVVSRVPGGDRRWPSRARWRGADEARATGSPPVRLGQRPAHLSAGPVTISTSWRRRSTALD